jgi:hypothetical protein
MNSPRSVFLFSMKLLADEEATEAVSSSTTRSPICSSRRTFPSGRTRSIANALYSRRPMGPWRSIAAGSANSIRAPNESNGHRRAGLNGACPPTHVVPAGCHRAAPRRGGARRAPRAWLRRPHLAQRRTPSWRRPRRPPTPHFASREHLITELFWRRLSALPETSIDRRMRASVRASATLARLPILVADEPELAEACTVAMLAANPDVKVLRDRIGLE